MVGSIDAENAREMKGKERRRRGFIDPLNLSGTDSNRLALFQGKAWWLDNLTNGGKFSDDNNAYRIVNATGINDDGVISATANYCAGGYDSTDHNSYCGDGNGEETLMAVKLVPIAGATADDIVQRKGGKPDVKREGGSLGYFALTLLGLLGFRKRKLKCKTKPRLTKLSLGFFALRKCDLGRCLIGGVIKLPQMVVLVIIRVKRTVL